MRSSISTLFAPSISSKTSSGDSPSSIIVDIGFIAPIRSSNVLIASSVAPGITWIIKPPAAFTELSGSTKTPRPTAEGTCSETTK